MIDLVAKELFLTRGIGVHEDKLTSFEYALRDAGISGTNIAGLAKRSTFVIDKNGIIKDVMREINVASHGQEILDSLKKIKV